MITYDKALKILIKLPDIDSKYSVETFSEKDMINVFYSSFEVSHFCFDENGIFSTKEIESLDEESKFTKDFYEGLPKDLKTI